MTKDFKRLTLNRRCRHRRTSSAVMVIAAKTIAALLRQLRESAVTVFIVNTPSISLKVGNPLCSGFRSQNGPEWP